MLENDDGADFLPVKLAAVLVTASLVLLLAATHRTGTDRRVVGDRGKSLRGQDCSDGYGRVCGWLRGRGR